MRILAIESSAVTASVAILEDDTLVAEYTINHKMTHSQTLLPMIDEIFSMVQLKPDDVDVIAVSKGPGSFTGLRGRKKYNELCRKCERSCKQSFRAAVIQCPHYLSKRRTRQ